MEDFFSHRTSEMLYEEEDYSQKVYRHHVFNHLSALSGAELDYFGADTAEYEFKVDSIIFKVLEDPDDGYRSMLGAIEYSEDQSSSIFFSSPVARVKIETYRGLVPDSEGEVCKCYRLVDVEDGHVWLEFGTKNTDDYYPYFFFRHNPRST